MNISANYLQLFDEMLAYHCAPTLAKVKPSSIITISNKVLHTNFKELLSIYNKRYANNDLVFRELCACDKKVLIIIYSPTLMKNIFQDVSSKKYLTSFGYSYTDDIDLLIEQLSKRVNDEQTFPHEIGLFLGYPLEDVVGFIEQKGQNFKKIGHWKVYGNLNIANQLFTAYNFCRDVFVNKFAAGIPLQQIVSEEI